MPELWNDDVDDGMLAIQLGGGSVVDIPEFDFVLAADDLREILSAATEAAKQMGTVKSDTLIADSLRKYFVERLQMSGNPSSAWIWKTSVNIIRHSDEYAKKNGGTVPPEDVPVLLDTTASTPTTSNQVELPNSTH